jgi:hypothetical protein
VGYNLLHHKRNEDRTTNTTNNRIYTAIWKELKIIQQTNLTVVQHQISTQNIKKKEREI